MSLLLQEVTQVTEELERSKLAEMTAEIVSAYVSHNQVLPAELPELIGSIAGRLVTLGSEQEQAEAAKPEPVVPIRRSLSRDHITCLLCGRKQKLLKRHLSSAHQLTPPEYREVFGLKPDYPMTAPSYVEMRAEIARRVGLGRPRKSGQPRPKAAAKTAR
jgi:MucR family transcriptional regulator, transcriptional regulator of exopolysaccharide biosynthesis